MSSSSHVDGSDASVAPRLTLFALVKAVLTDEILAAVSAAIHAADAAAKVSTSGNIVIVETKLAADDLRTAIQNAGYIAEVTSTLPRAESTFSFGRLIGQSLLWCVAGTFIVPVATLIALMILRLFDPVCGTPGDSGGCEMGIAAITAAAIPVGSVLGFGYGFWRGLR